MRHARSVRFPPVIAAALVTAAMLLPASVVTAAAPAAGPTATVEAWIGDCEAFGTSNLGPSDRLVIEHRRADGTVRTTHTVAVVDSAWDWSCPAPLLRGGDELAFFIEGDTTPFKVLTIPALRLTTDRVANKVRGVIPGIPDGWRLDRYPCDADESCAWDGVDRTVTRDPSTGAFVEPIGGLWGLDAVQLSWSDQSDTIRLFPQVAQLITRLGSARLTGSGSNAGQKITITLKRGTTVVNASATTDINARFAVTLRRNGAPLKIKAGDVITASFASDATMKVPPSFVATDGSTVYGRCFKGAKVVYNVIDGAGHYDHSQSVTAELDGGWGWPDVVPSGWRIRMSCANAKGDVLVAETVVN